jgi:CubicO group peptidase (beta-lactamase class C family)
VGTFAYSNTGIALAASLTEAATGTRFKRLSRRGLFEPLGMTHTGWFLSDFPDPTIVASPHDAQGHPLPHYGYPTWRDGQLRASVHDEAQSLALLMNGGRVGGVQLLSAATVAEMLRPQVASARDPQGLSVQWKRGLAGHMGGDDGVRSFVVFDPETRVGAVVLVNQDGPRATAAAVEAVGQTVRNPRLAASLGH